MSGLILQLWKSVEDYFPMDSFKSGGSLQLSEAEEGTT